ncbi:hypothetical protein PISL3812_06681 [Talaromyces islandicus]|uniref:Uncharacterized protein n=1 Tax=Talaromyces islandicus TaxID=28573 RepID=A0A0U1M2N5_TALIS|nr:hypothetical protein PISL3812_06681 [Talaromyces islandicus]
MAAAVATRPLLPTTTPSHLSSLADDATTTTATYTVDIVNLNNLLSRLEHNIFSSSLDLRLVQQSHLHRTRVGANVEYANTLFTKIERSLPSIKSPETRHQRTTDLAKKRARLARLRERWEEIKTEQEQDGEKEEEEEEEEEGEEDLLAGIAEPVEPVKEEEEEEEGKEEHGRGTRVEEQDEVLAATTSTLRQRRPDTTAMSITASSTTPEQSSSLSPAAAGTSTTGFKPFPTTTTSTTETTLSTHRAEQESLTDSLINLASQLKASSQAFQSSLENEKSILDRAVEGLDRNVTGLDAAGQRMGVLRRMSEGRGWWGRMLMYAWIFGLWLVAIAIVYLGPKLRF